MTELQMDFIGVTTGDSLITRVFPRWAQMLDLPTHRLVGHDVTVDAPLPVHRRLIEAIKHNPASAGALVTTHKISVYEAAAELFDELDDDARMFGEISCIANRDGRMTGYAKDPLTAQLSLDELLTAEHFGANPDSAVLCFGTGGAGLAITTCLGRRQIPPTAIICTDVSPARLAHAQAIHRAAGPNALRYDYVPGDAATSAALLASLPAASVVVNATGLGKDRPGSPLPEDVLFPERSVVWDLNYRGDLRFLTDARRQQAARKLTLADGWRYFVHGWSQAIAEVFDVEITTDTVEALALAAAG